jgi:putative hydrolase of the HAD superfamily
MLRTLIFDLGNVLIPFDLRRGYEAIRKHCPLPADEIPQRIVSSGLVHRLERGEMSAAEFFERLTQSLQLNLGFNEFREIWGAIFLPDPIIPDSTLAALARRYRLLMLSNTNGIHFDFLEERYPILKHFHGRVLSHEVKALKPEPAIYQAALNQAGCSPEECFYTDDIPAFVDGAKDAGIDAVLFTGMRQLESDLHRRGVTW